MKPAYFTLAYGQPGCLPDSDLGACSISTRRELMDAVRDAVAFYNLPKAVLKQARWNRIWSHAKRHGLSSISLELSTASMNGCLMFMGLTQDEYQQHQDTEDF